VSVTDAKPGNADTNTDSYNTDANSNYPHTNPYPDTTNNSNCHTHT
jgi:hypothetical protein